MASGLTMSGDVQGKRVSGLGDAKLGTVKELSVDLATGAIAFVLVEGQNLLRSSGKFHPVPWAAVRYDSVADAFLVELAKDEFKDSPSYDREQLATISIGWDEQATRFFSARRSGTQN
jgi:sporulation protein YlmC with PRC-barrel domain